MPREMRLLGAPEGAPEGPDGPRDGIADGKADGALDGLRDGEPEGVREGLSVFARPKTRRAPGARWRLIHHALTIHWLRIPSRNRRPVETR